MSADGQTETKWFTTAEVAERLGCTLSQVYRRIQRGDLKARQIQVRNLQYRVDEQELQHYIDSGGLLSAPKLDDKGMLRPTDVAQLTGYSVETVRRMCKEGRLAHVRGIGEKAHLRIPRSAVQELLKGVE